MVAAGATALALVGSVREAKALTLITDPVDTNLVTGIEDLDIGGSLFDVDFVVDSFDNIFTNTGLTPTFLDDNSGAEAAANAIISALGTNFKTATETNAGAFEIDQFTIPFEVNSFLGQAWTDTGNLLDNDLAGTTLFEPDAEIIVPIAVFTPADPEPVPEPFAILGSLSALGLGAALKKKQQKKG